MKTEIEKRLTEGLSKTVKDYVGIDITDSDKGKALKILTTEVKMLREEESLRLNDGMRKERHVADIDNQKERLKLEKDKNKLEEKIRTQQAKNDAEKITLEKTKIGNDKEFKKEELKLSKTKQDNELKKVESELTLNKEKFEYERKERDARLDVEKVKAQLERDKYETQKVQENDKIMLEKSKFNHTKRLEKQKYNLEMEKIKLEYAKLDVERQNKIADQKKEKRNFFSDIAAKALGILPVAAYFALGILSLKLTYKDDGIVPSSTKDFMRKI